ncbi:transmembrane protein 115 [Callorhinchus milii]|uniref:Transmembrane protein 115 n=1 Tax=Callorhinchus milii TaxID=7868 RepID=A0A4W3GC05_CALMI|nr:transmembrane protein 115 [Callorhinchus milii]|eukprot:gi/632946696/ref/XP_007888686.1/ PREDICTED: transmembrane protein 115 [Callorhinchus milii]
MNRYLPVARQHFLAAVASTSVVVKAVCATVLLLYCLSFLVDTVHRLGVTPGYLFPPNFWVWTLVTHAVAENHIWDVCISLGTVIVAGRLLEPLWGALELLIFFAVINVSVGILGGLSYLLTYVATFNLDYLFTVRIHGMLGFCGGVLVALKQTMGDSVVIKVPQVQMKDVPMMILVIISVLRLTTLLSSSMLSSYGYGVLTSWVYLRFYQKHSRGRGDMSDHFAFATFFPEILQPLMSVVANVIYSVLVKIKICKKTVKRYDVGAPSSITISLPGTDPQDAERRRQLALKALNERLKRVEDQAAWPSMDEDEKDDGSDVPLLPGGDGDDLGAEEHETGMGAFKVLSSDS